MLLTKLHIPTPSQDTIHRQQLSKLLDEAQNKKLVLVSAPAGYGKTTLISDWIFQNKVDAVWCSIDKRDNDPIEFLKLLVTAVNSVSKKTTFSISKLFSSTVFITICCLKIRKFMYL